MGEFNPGPSERVVIGGQTYEVMPHPAVETFAFGQEGRKAFVYQIRGLEDGRFYALKKFKLAFRIRELLGICTALAPFASIPGLGVCYRQCINQARHSDVLSVYPDLEYAVLMPWIDGVTWYDVVVGMIALNRAQSIAFADATALVLAALEDAGLAHCDLSSGNIIINRELGTAHLVDVEDMYAPGFSPPSALPAGSDGYAHRTAEGGLWKPKADRFAGAVLLAEMLTWYEPAIRQEAGDEHFFSPEELQQDAPRYQLVRDVLAGLDARLVELFDCAWASRTLDDCPPLAAWREITRGLHHQARVQLIAPEWRPIVPAGEAKRPAIAPSSPISPPKEPPELRPEEKPPAAKPLPTQPSVREGSAESDRPSPPPQGGPISVPQASLGSPLIGFRPLGLPDHLKPDTSEDDRKCAPLAETSHRPITIPEEASPAEVAFDGLQVETSSTPEVYDFDPLEADIPEDADSLEEVDPTAAEKSAARVSRAEDGLLDRLSSLSSGLLDWLPGRKGSPADRRSEPVLHTPQLDLSGVDERNRPILAWTESPGARYYELQEATSASFLEVYTTRVKKGTHWQSPRRRFGTFFYRVRAVAGEQHSAWSNVVRVRIRKG